MGRKVVYLRSTIVTWIGAFCDELLDGFKESIIGARDDEVPCADLDSTWSAMTWLGVGTGLTVEGSFTVESGKGIVCEGDCCNASEISGLVAVDTTNSSSRFFTASLMEAV